MKNRRIINGVRSILGDDNLWLDREVFVDYCHDYKTGFSGIPMGVCFPRTTNQVQEIVKLTNKYGVVIVPRGAGTGRSGGAVPPDNSLVISTEMMRKTREIDEQSLFIEVESGKILSSLQSEVENLGLFYPPDPASFERCTLGGNVAENAGGPRAFKYGVTRDYVLGLEVILPNGELINTGSRARKHVVGYDMTSLLVGSEGTLGIITSIILRLLPRPPSKRTFWVLFSTIEASAQAINKMIELSIIPVTMELMDKYALSVAKELSSEFILEDAQAALIIEFDGHESQVESDTSNFLNLMKSLDVLFYKMAENDADVRKIWDIRRNMSDLLRKLYRFKLSEDVVVPRQELPLLVRAIEETASSLPIDIAQYGHAGDGNLHVNFLWNDPDHQYIALSAIEKVFDFVLKLRGTISGEHGIGLTKRPYLPLEQSDALIAVQRSLKEAIDPDYLMNPGKIFPVPRHIKKPIFHGKWEESMEQTKIIF